MRVHHVRIAALLASISYATMGIAQDASPAGAPSEDASAQQGLAEIVVTAQKRSENLQRTPVTVSAVASDRLSFANIVDSQQLQRFVPGLQATRGGINNVIFLRGIGTNSGVPGNEPAVATYVDGVYRPSSSGSDFAFNNAERVEVLKGPQGTLFGRNSAGGLINVITKDPSFTPVVNGKVGFANYETVSAEGYVSTGLSSTMAVDLAAQYSKQHKGWGTNVFNGHEAYLSDGLSLRSKLLFKPSDATKLTFIGDFSSVRNDVGANYAVTPGTVTNFGVGKLGGFYDTDADYDPRQRVRQGGVSGKIEQDLSWAQLSTITSWRKVAFFVDQNIDSTSRPVYRQPAHGRQRTFTHEFNVASLAGSPIKWIGGFYYFNDLAWYDPYGQIGTSFGSATGGIATYPRQKTISYAGYAQATAPLLSDTTHLTLGIRYTHDKKTASAYRRAAPSGALLTLNYPAGYPSSNSSGRFSYKASIDHSFTPEVMVYATFSTGFKSGSYNLANITQLPTEDEELTSYEVGLKSEWFDRRVRLNLAAYHYKYDNLQVRSYTSLGPVNTNASSATLEGIDVELTAAPIPELMLSVSANYNNSRYGKFPTAVCTLPLVTGGYSGAFVCDASGNDVALANPFTLASSIDFTTALGSGELRLGVDASYQDAYYFDVQNIVKQSSYTLVGAQAAWTTGDGHWTFSIFGRNLTKTKYYSNRVLTAGFGDVYAPGAPRTYGVSAAFKF